MQTCKQEISKITVAHAHPVRLILMNEIHLVYKAENLGISRVLKNCLEAGLIIVEIPLEFPALDIKHVDEHLNVAEYAFSLTGNVALHE